MPRRHRLLFTISEFMYGSKVRRLHDLIKRLDQSLFEIEVAALVIGDEATEQIVSLGVNCFELIFFPPRRPAIYKYAKFFYSPFIFFSKDYELVHSLCYQSMFTEPLIVKWFSKAKYIYTKTNLEWDNHPLNWYWKTRLADKVISISRATDQLLNKKGFGSKTAKISNGIDTMIFSASDKKREILRKQYGVPSKAFVFGCAAQFVEWKDHMLLVSAFEKLCENHENVYLFFCGSHHNDEYYRRCVKRVEASRAKNRIMLLGTLADMPGFYSAIDCFVLPSKYEPFGYVYIESMSCKRPVIACRASGPLDIIEEGKSGFFVEIGEIDDLVSKMEIYIKNRNILVEHGVSARLRVERFFSTEAMVLKHETLYRHLLKID